jgi:sporulation protein YlmC with PRC-barrel domain
MHLDLNHLKRKTVLDTAGMVVGDVAAPLIDTETWLVDTLRVRLRRRSAAELDVRWSFFRPPAIDVPTGLVHGAGDAIILRVSLAELRESPVVQGGLVTAMQ